MKCKDCYKDCPYRCYTTNAECLYTPCIEIEETSCREIEETSFNWQSFRAEAAKDILCAMISNEGVADERNVDDFTKDNQVKDAVLYADKLISKLEEKEEK